MKFQFLGTAAAEGIPALFCRCEVCAAAERAGGRNIRGRSGALVNGRVLIDFPQDIYAFKLRFGLDLAGVTHLFVTHSHVDHLDAKELVYLHEMYSRNPGGLLKIYGNQQVLQVIRQDFSFDMNEVPGCVELHEVKPFSPVEAGELTLTPLLADHDPREQCVFYLVEEGEKRMLFANDTTMFPEETFAFLAGRRLDVVSLDCTSGKFACPRSHMGFPDNLEVRRRLLELGAADGDTRFYSHHFSHNGEVNYDDFPALAGDSGFRSTYDGLELEL